MTIDFDNIDFNFPIITTLLDLFDRTTLLNLFDRSNSRLLTSNKFVNFLMSYWFDFNIFEQFYCLHMFIIFKLIYN